MNKLSCIITVVSVVVASLSLIGRYLSYNINYFGVIHPIMSKLSLTITFATVAVASSLINDRCRLPFKLM